MSEAKEIAEVDLLNPCLRFKGGMLLFLLLLLFVGAEGRDDSFTLRSLLLSSSSSTRGEARGAEERAEIGKGEGARGELAEDESAGGEDESESLSRKHSRLVRIPTLPCALGRSMWRDRAASARGAREERGRGGTGEAEGEEDGELAVAEAGVLCDAGAVAEEARVTEDDEEDDEAATGVCVCVRLWERAGEEEVEEETAATEERGKDEAHEEEGGEGSEEEADGERERDEAAETVKSDSDPVELLASRGGGGGGGSIAETLATAAESSRRVSGGKGRTKGGRGEEAGGNPMERAGGVLWFAARRGTGATIEAEVAFLLGCTALSARR